MVNFGPLVVELISLVWGTPANFNGFRFLAAFLHSQTAALNRGRHLYSAGRPSRWALAHISSCIFFAIDDVIVTWVNTCTSVMGISTEDKYLMESLRENKKYLAKRLLKMFPNWTVGQCEVDHYPIHRTTCVVNFLISAFCPPRLQFLLGDILSNRFGKYFLFFHKDLIKYLC